MDEWIRQMEWNGMKCITIHYMISSSTSIFFLNNFYFYNTVWTFAM